jgi:hypothetical protein
MHLQRDSAAGVRFLACLREGRDLKPWSRSTTKVSRSHRYPVPLPIPATRAACSAATGPRGALHRCHQRPSREPDSRCHGPDDGARLRRARSLRPDQQRPPGRHVAWAAGTVLSAPLSSLDSPGCTVHVVATATSTTTELQGSTRTIPGDLRPQVVGVFSDLQGQAPAGLSVTAEIDDRYSSSPTPLKLAAMLLGAVCVLGSVVALYRLERGDGRRHVRALPARWWVPRRLDVVVVGVLGVWYLIGANTSDDGYLLTMARAAQSSGYMGNYFRWLDVTEAPFGWTYQLISVMSRISTASPWIRLPTLAASILCWLLISREVLPRLGRRVRCSTAARWAAAAVFLLLADLRQRPAP